MLEIMIPQQELYDEVTNSFIYIEAKTLQLEHSLISLSKWESKWCIPFLHKDKKNEKTTEQIIDYIRCMTITQNVKSEVYNNLSAPIFEQIKAYIDAPMTATWFNDTKVGGTKSSKEIITAEIIYYWMIANNIPMECQKWHLNRLLTLIKVCGIKNSPPKKTSKKDILSKRRALNEQRRNVLNSKG